MAKRTTFVLISNMPKETRESRYSWGSWDDVKNEGWQARVPKKYLDAAKLELKNGNIKWYTLYGSTIDYTTGLIACEILVNEASEEIPPVEFNVAAKGFVPPPKEMSKKIPKSVWSQVAMPDIPVEGNQF